MDSDFIVSSQNIYTSPINSLVAPHYTTISLPVLLNQRNCSGTIVFSITRLLTYKIMKKGCAQFFLLTFRNDYLSTGKQL